MNKRDALEQIRRTLQLSIGVGLAITKGDVLAMDRIARDALEAPSEMQQLVEWLESKCGTPYNTALDQGWEMAFKVILRHIRTKFLGEEK